jgi:hypothetical protein
MEQIKLYLSRVCFEIERNTKYEKRWKLHVNCGFPQLDLNESFCWVNVQKNWEDGYI